MADISAMTLWMSLSGLASLVVVALAVVAIVGGRRNGQSELTAGSAPLDAANADPAVQELRRRLAAGEIDEDEYLQRQYRAPVRRHREGHLHVNCHRDPCHAARWSSRTEGPASCS